MRSIGAALLWLLAKAGAADRITRCISGETLDWEERGDAVTTPGKSLALEAQSGEPMAMKERSPMKESRGRPVKLIREGGRGGGIGVWNFKDLTHASGAMIERQG